MSRKMNLQIFVRNGMALRSFIVMASREPYCGLTGTRGPQAVMRAMEQWFMNRKRELPKLASAGLLPGEDGTASYYFRCKDEQGGKNPKQKYIAALHGLAAMRLLCNHTLKEAIALSKQELGGIALYSAHVDADSKQPKGRSAWRDGVKHAREVFHDLFFRQDELSLSMRASDAYRRIGGLPAIEDPISYQRYCDRRVTTSRLET
ncbi:MAG: hypothetical protein WDN28_07675 [Chthoniobacter sp.]